MKKFFILFLSITLFSQTRFIIFGDTQFQNPDIFQQFINLANQENVDFTVHVGDMIHGHTHSKSILYKEWEIFFNEISNLKTPFYYTAGNHDLTTKEGLEVFKDVWKNKLYYSFDFKDIHFIVLNTFTNLNSFYTIDKEQINWLVNDLEANKNKPTFVSLHPPLYYSDWEYWKNFHKLFIQYNVKGVFTGHNHIFNHKNIDGINYFCINTSGNLKFIDNFYTGIFWGYILVEYYNNDSIKYSIQTLNNKYSLSDFDENLASIIKKISCSNHSILYNNTKQIDTISYTLQNLSDKQITYNLSWDIKEKSILIEPLKSQIPLDAKSFKEIKFIINKNSETSNNPARLKVKYDYIDNSKSYPLYYYVDLIIPKIAHAKFSNSKIIIDGIVENKEWNNSSIIENFNHKIKTKVYISYDSTYLYFGFINNEPTPSKMTASASGNLPYVFGDDDIEFHFYLENQPDKFYRIMLNPNNTQFISGPTGRFSYPVDSKTYVGKDFWSGEIRIKFRDLNITKYQPLRFNIRRNRTQSYPNNIIEWQETNKYPPYLLHKFGRLKFD